MPGRNTTYRGPEIMVKLMRATNLPWQLKSMRRGILISKAQYRERYQSAAHSSMPIVILLGQPFTADSQTFKLDGVRVDNDERTLRNIHSATSDRMSSDQIESPYSKYCSMTSALGDTSWGQGSQPSTIFRFDIWRSDVWKGKHEIERDPELQRWLADAKSRIPTDKLLEFLLSQTAPDWDRGAEFEWLALGGTRIYNIETSPDGLAWQTLGTPDPVDFWWEAL
jgi:hypothetical protein